MDSSNLKINSVAKDTGSLYGKFSHPFGIIFNQSNIDIRKSTLKKLSFFPELEPNAKVLELGGTGQDAVAFAQMGFDTTYIDLSAENIAKTKNFINGQNLNLNLINSNFLTYSFNQKFDLIRSRGVIHHILEPEKTLQKINNLLQVNGFFHFNLYRSGTFYYWFVSHIREIAKTINFEKFMDVLLRVKLTEDEEKNIGNQTIKSKSKFYNIIIDDLYVPILNPGNYFDVIKDLDNLSFEILKTNKIQKHLDHDILYPDFPQKKNQVEFDCKKVDHPKSINESFYVLDMEKERRITVDDQVINSNNLLFDKLLLTNKENELFKKEDFIKQVIILYKDCYLLAVKDIDKNERHRKLGMHLGKLCSTN